MTDPVVHGVDFSGASGGGGPKIVVATRDSRGGIDLRRGAGRQDLLQLIRTSCEDGTPHLWRVDAPLSLPESVLDAHGVPPDWLSLATWMRGFEDPREWRRALRAVDRKERKRTCDRAARAPLAPMNLRVFKQTWTAVCELMLPLVEEGIHLAPMHPTRSPVVVAEACPASVLHRIGESPRGYKGREPANAERRRALCGVLAEHGLELSEDHVRQAEADPQGDVLDAAILLLPPVHEPVPREALVEGWIW